MRGVYRKSAWKKNPDNFFFYPGKISRSSTRALLPINIRYNNGITISVRQVEKVSPQTIDVATGPQIKEWPPNPVANENKPAIVVSDVIKIGITRRLAA